MIRFLDIFFASLALLFIWPLLLILLVICWFDTGSPLFRQVRVGRNRLPFKILKFRTMRRGTPSLSTHLVSREAITALGSFLRRTKLDELPQLFNVITGDMSLVGPRPNLYCQVEVITARDKFQIYQARPGITGLAQVCEIDMSTPELLAESDAKMLKTLNVFNYFKYIFMTVACRGSGNQME